MTGYGKATAEYNGKTYTVEVKTLNSKFLDLSLRLPSGMKEQEMEVRADITKILERGKIEVSVNTDNGAQKNIGVNKELFKSYYAELSSLGEELNFKSGDILRTILSIPEVLSSPKKELEDEEANVFKSAIHRAIEDCDKFRMQEGEETAKEIGMRVESIRTLLKEVEKYDAPRIEYVKAKLRGSLTDIISKNSLDNNRFEQELVFYIEKMDMTEEKIRLTSHLNYFLETMKDSAAPGKKLGFISQEMGREINTLGSKANDAEIQKIVVQMKDELEKIKEQLSNIL